MDLLFVFDKTFEFRGGPVWIRLLEVFEMRGDLRHVR
jgi:hypothetical protein